MHSNYVGAIAVAAYSYMALVPIIQPFAIRLVTTKKERRIHMTYSPKNVSKTTKIAFPIVVTIIVGLISPARAILLLGQFSYQTASPSGRFPCQTLFPAKMILPQIDAAYEGDYIFVRITTLK